MVERATIMLDNRWVWPYSRQRDSLVHPLHRIWTMDNTQTTPNTSKDSISINKGDLVEFMADSSKYKNPDGSFDRNNDFGKKLYENGVIDEKGYLNKNFISKWDRR